MKQPKYRPIPRAEKPLCVWEDATSYSQSDGYPRVPRSWRMRLTPDVRLTVVSEHIYHKGEWAVRCEPWFGMTPIGLKVADGNAPQAQRIALAMVRAKINELNDALMSASQ